MQETTKQIVIVKSIQDDGTTNYNMRVDSSIQREELIAILAQMTSNVLADVLPDNGKKHRPEYVG